MPARKYDDSTIAEALERRERGESGGQIAAALNMTRSAVDYHCLAQGVTPGGRRVEFRNKTAVVKRGKHLVRLFSPIEDRLAESMRIKGIGIAEIARALDRKPVSVRCRLQALARREEAGTTS